MPARDSLAGWTLGCAQYTQYHRGVTMTERVWRAASVIVLTALIAITFRGLDRPFGNGDEVIYAQEIREMQRSGDYLALRWHGQADLLRPSTPFVLASLGTHVLDGERGLRLLPAMASAAVLAMIFALAFWLWRRHDVALVAVMLCAGVPSFHLFSRALLSDPLFLAAIVLALFGALLAQGERVRPGFVLCGVGLGAAVAFKSLAAAIPAAALAPWLVYAARRHWQDRALRTTVLVSGLAFLALAVPFFAYGLHRFGDQFVRDHLGLSLASRVAGATRVGMPGGALAYARYVYLVDGPAVAAWMLAGCVGGLVLAWRERASGLGLVASFALMVFAGLSLVGTRLPHYLLPVYPAAALATAGLYARVLTPERLNTLPRRLLGPVVALALMLHGMARPPHGHFLPSDDAHVLGQAARSVVAERIYALDWYAPALGYYADKPWHLLAAPDLAAEIGPGYLFRHAGNVHEAPPWPQGRFLVAASRARLAHEEAHGQTLRVFRVVAETPTHVLIVAQAN